MAVCSWFNKLTTNELGGESETAEKAWGDARTANRCQHCFRLYFVKQRTGLGPFVTKAG